MGRQAELSALQAALEQAQRGRLQLVFVTGAPGIGKSTLVRQFLAQVPATPPLWIGTGQCIEHDGAGEAYLPWLDALGRLGRDAGREARVAALRRSTLMWLVHLPLLVEPGEQEQLQHQTQGLPPERMLRELVEALTVITRERMVVLVLEDLQWSDRATVEMLSYLARRPEPLRLLVLGTYRPAEVIARVHPLRQTVQELVAHQLGHVLRLELLTEEQVQRYVTQRLGASPANAELGELLYRRTDGNALFVGAAARPPPEARLPRGSRGPVAPARRGGGSGAGSAGGLARSAAEAGGGSGWRGATGARRSQCEWAPLHPGGSGRHGAMGGGGRRSHL